MSLLHKFPFSLRRAHGDAAAGEKIEVSPLVLSPFDKLRTGQPKPVMSEAGHTRVGLWCAPG